MRSRILWAGLVCGALGVAHAVAGDYYADGTKLNIGTARGAVLTSSGASNVGFLQHPCWGVDTRWNNNFGPGWLQVEFPDVYQISSYRLAYHSVVVSTAYDLKVSTDGSSWTTVHTYSNATLNLSHDGYTSTFTTGAFASVSAKYVRYEFAGHNGGETNGPGSGHNQMILTKVQFFGPNTNVPVSTRFSLAQSAWAGGSCTYYDCWHAPSTSSCPEMVDDSVATAGGFGNLLRQIFPNTPGYDDDDPAPNPANEPSRFFVALNDLYYVDRVAFSSIGDSRTARDVRIYTSFEASGSDWTLRKTVTNVPNSTAGYYYEVALDAAYPTRRVRLEVDRAWNTGEDWIHVPQCYMAEIYVFGVPPPKGTAVECVGGEAGAGGAMPVSDGFETYASGSALAGQGAWTSSTNAHVVQQATVYAGTKAAGLPAAGVLAGAMDGANRTKVWTDVRIMPQFGVSPPGNADSNASLRLYVDAAGVVNVATNGGWMPLAQDAWGAAAPLLATGAWVRLSLLHDYAAQRVAVFADGRLLRADLPFLSSSATNYGSLRFQQTDGTCFLDEVYVGTNYPASLTNDWDFNEVADALELQATGAVSPIRYSVLPFLEPFDSYAGGVSLQDLRHRGWGASASDVAVQGGTVQAGPLAAVVPDGGRVASNLVQSYAAPQVWTDFWLKPVVGDLPTNPVGASATLRLAFTTNGYVAIRTGAGWDVCTTGVGHAPVASISNEWVRLTVASDYARRWSAVFLNGQLLRDAVFFLSSGAAEYRKLQISNPSLLGSAYLDSLVITNSYPGDLTGDADGDGRADAWEIHRYGATRGYPPYVMFMVR